MSPETIEALAEQLEVARQHGRAVPRLTVAHPDLALADAYAIQDGGVRLRRERGETLVGFKMGLTSEAKRQQMGLHAPVYGQLTDRMSVAAGGVFRLAGAIHPKIEPELAFELGSELRGEVTLEEAKAACKRVYAAMEILDSRYEGFKYFSLPDVVADNSSSSHFVLAPRGRALEGIELDRLRMVIEVNGETRQEARSDAISGHPLRSVVQLCALLAARGGSVPAGSIVLAGAATVAEVLRPGMRVRLVVEGLEDVEVNVEG